MIFNYGNYVLCSRTSEQGKNCHRIWHFPQWVPSARIKLSTYSPWDIPHLIRLLVWFAPMIITLTNTLGALEIGAFLGVFLFGVVSLQTFYYYTLYPDDSWVKKTLVRRKEFYHPVYLSDWIFFLKVATVWYHLHSPSLVSANWIFSLFHLGSAKLSILLGLITKFIERQLFTMAGPVCWWGSRWLGSSQSSERSLLC